ncbi:ABC transporter permease [Massilia sp. CF038]|uniref:ABC transporter permease n=1 Tax=Massilia sp. CF038 TaxID=1881045 RepID=UPI000913DC48|nr:FtsX-like permease family protein [Massilia sp. CF038]SHH69378.1 putative ABC transport system permease protein [Massilia sp. CF038]
MHPILSALLRNKTGAILVAVQVAISLAILANALHIVNVRQGVAARPSGLVDEVSTFNISTRWLRKENAAFDLAVQKRETALLRAIPGVLGVASTNQMPLSNSGSSTSVAIDRKQVNESASTAMYETGDSLVAAWGLRLVQGRDFTAADVLELDMVTSTEQPKTVIITQALADKLWPGQASVIGKTMLFGTGDTADATQIIGVVERLQSPWAPVDESAEYSTILPMRSLGTTPGSSYTVRTEPGQRDRIMKEAEEILRKATATPVIIKSKSTSEDRKQRYRADVALSWMLITVSVLLLIITASGIVGMASLWVTQRRKQIGVRRALGARRADILRYFISENVMITSLGVASGVLLAVGLNQLLVSKLEMARLPLPYLIGGGAVFYLLGVVAVYGPAWKAATISPALATRSA